MPNADLSFKRGVKTPKASAPGRFMTAITASARTISLLHDLPTPFIYGLFQGDNFACSFAEHGRDNNNVTYLNGRSIGKIPAVA